ncbi:hypothetical protein C8R43DRAFT_242504 [Mycena crocata]|nr:hypothetical protein C8R43DRAFT_242504 [Mycena crocata]
MPPPLILMPRHLQDYPSPRRTLHCPKRSIWCGSERVHVLVFAPTHEYWYETDTWAVSTKMAGYLGKEFDFFINQGSHVYYVGTYKVHSLRTVHPPGSRITSDVSQAAILRATGLSAHLKEKITECFADGEIKTECFGLQCVGFDQQLYDSLRQRFKAGAGAGKRKAGSEDFRDKGKAKSQKLY